MNTNLEQFLGTGLICLDIQRLKQMLTQLECRKANTNLRANELICSKGLEHVRGAANDPLVETEGWCKRLKFG